MSNTASVEKDFQRRRIHAASHRAEELSGSQGIVEQALDRLKGMWME
jgi:hypothetical protein